MMRYLSIAPWRMTKYQLIMDYIAQKATFSENAAAKEGADLLYTLGTCLLYTSRISKPKTEAGIRTIPMLDVVKDSFQMLYEEQLENGFNETEIDGMSGFIFCNRDRKSVV